MKCNAPITAPLSETEIHYVTEAPNTTVMYLRQFSPFLSGDHFSVLVFIYLFYVCKEMVNTLSYVNTGLSTLTAEKNNTKFAFITK